jgi:hypothetical protein
MFCKCGAIASLERMVFESQFDQDWTSLWQVTGVRQCHYRDACDGSRPNY